MKERLRLVVASALLVSQAAVAQPIFRIDQYLSEDEKRSTGLYKLTAEELYQLNLYYSSQIEFALASGRKSAEEKGVVPSEKRAEIDLRDLEGAVVVAEDGTFLGVISRDRYDDKSLANKYGAYGDKYSSDSIWNDYGTYGGKYSDQSPFNSYTSTPPQIYSGRQFVAYLSVNKSLAPRVDPSVLQAWMQAR